MLMRLSKGEKGLDEAGVIKSLVKHYVPLQGSCTVYKIKENQRKCVTSQLRQYMHISHENDSEQTQALFVSGTLKESHYVLCIYYCRVADALFIEKSWIIIFSTGL